MRVWTQGVLIDSLQKKIVHELDVLEQKHERVLLSLWRQARLRLIGSIMVNYREHFGRGRWDLPKARHSGALYKIEHALRSILDEFKRDSIHTVRTALNRIHRTSTLKHAWLLDQMTPDSYRVSLPAKPPLYEAAVPSPEDAAALFPNRWGAWIDAYESSLVHNLNLNLINEGSMADAADEVDASRPGTPSAGLWDALVRVYNDLAVGAQAQGIQDIGDANPDGMQEVWQTREDARVCDDCDPNLGLTEEEADGSIPQHPNCRCYWRMVPTAYADLLRSGDADSQALADAMDAENLVPDSLVIRDGETGDVVGKLIVTFDEWMQGKGLAITGQ